MSLSPAQLRRFWLAFRPAWLSHAGRSGLNPADRAAAEAWRHAVTAEECGGVTSVKQLGNGDFDAIMLRFAVEAGDTAAVVYWSPAEERRLRHLIRRKLDELDELDPTRPHDTGYILAILRRSRLRASIPPGLLALDDIPADHLRIALQIIDTHRRRLRDRRAPSLAADLASVPF